MLCNPPVLPAQQFHPCHCRIAMCLTCTSTSWLITCTATSRLQVVQLKASVQRTRHAVVWHGCLSSPDQLVHCTFCYQTWPLQCCNAAAVFMQTKLQQDVQQMCHACLHDNVLSYDKGTNSDHDRVGDADDAECRCGPMVDLCRGPHLPNTGYLKTQAVNNLSRAFWRADVTKDPLQVGLPSPLSSCTCSSKHAAVV